MIALLTLGLYPSSGGPAKSIRAFRDALGAEVVSWVDPAELVAQDLIWDRTTVVTGSAAPVLKQLQIPVNGSTAAAERLIAQSRLVSVHSFWRWHNAWIHKVCRRHGVPYWYVPHGSLDPYVFESGTTTKRLFMRGVGRTFLRDAATVVYSTEREREKARDIVGHDRAEVIHWPLADSDFRKRDSGVRAPGHCGCRGYGAMGRAWPAQQPANRRSERTGPGLPGQDPSCRALVDAGRGVGGLYAVRGRVVLPGLL